MAIDNNNKKKSNANTWLMDRHPLYANRLFYRYGQLIGQHPVWFLVVPIVVALGLCPGVMQLKRLDNGDTMLWFTSQNQARRINDLNTKKWFSTLDTACSCDNSTRDDCAKIVPPSCKGGVENALDMLGCNRLQVLAFARGSRSVTDPDVMAELIRLDTFVSLSFNAADRKKPIMYYDDDEPDRSVCQRRNDGTCVQFSILTGVKQQISKLPGMSKPSAQNQFLLDMMKPEKKDDFDAMLNQGTPKFYYPYDQSGSFIAPLYGGRITYMRQNETWKTNVKAGQVKSISAMQMFYCFDRTKTASSNLFTRHLASKLKSVYRTNKLIDVITASTWSAGENNNREIIEVAVRFLICILAALIFAFLAAFVTGGPRTAKPWFAVIGVLFQLMIICAAFGFVGWIGVAIVDFSLSTALVVLAIGIIDVFEMLAQWSSTNINAPVPQRMGAVLSTTMLSIITTAIMNIISFAIDCGMVNAKAVQVYATMATITPLFQLIFNLTALPALLAFFGQLESKRRQTCCCCLHVSSITRRTPIASAMCCAENGSKEQDVTIWHVFQQQMRRRHRRQPYWYHDFNLKSAVRFDYFKIVQAPICLCFSILSYSFTFKLFLNFHYYKVPICVLLSFVAYAAICGYLCTRIEVGLKPQNLAPAELDGRPNGLEAYVNNFRTFSFQIEVILQGTNGDEIEYWDGSTRQMILSDLLFDLHRVKNIAPPAISRNCLRDFDNYTAKNNLNISTKAAFSNTLRQKFFREKKIDRTFFLDVGFGDDGLTIEASRFVIWAVNSIDVTSSALIVDGLRLVASKYQQYGIDIHFFSGDFDLIEPMMGVTYITVWCILVHMTVFTVVSQVAWVRPMPSFLIGFATASLFLGVIAINLAWNVQLDPISCFGIISSMSLAISLPVKLTSALVDAESEPTSVPFQRSATNTIIGSVQSSITCLVAVMALATSPIYLVTAYFKFIFIALLLSLYHTIFLLLIVMFYLRIRK